MSARVLSLAADLFSVDPRPRSLTLEQFISAFALIFIVVEFLLFGYLMLDSLICNEKGADIPADLALRIPAKVPLDNYVSLLCGTQIRMDGIALFIQNLCILIFFVAVFYFNKYFIIALFSDDR